MLFESADKLSWQILKETLLGQGDGPPIILYAAPVMITLVIIEWIISNYQKKDLYSTKDFWASFAIGWGNILTSALSKTAVFYLVWLTYYYIAPFTWPTEGWGYWMQYPICLIFLDKARYWAHRVAHRSRFWWATHVPHHSSEHYNFSVSFRLSWVQQLKVLFFLPVAAMGFDPIAFFIIHQIEVLYQFWLHTELIRKLPAPIEYIFTTPSHHRVHHGRNREYIDQNFGSTLIIWDRMFGTFTPEKEKVQYGITDPVGSYNPIVLVFHEFKDIAVDVWQAKGMRNKYRAMFSYPGDYRKSLEEEN